MLYSYLIAIAGTAILLAIWTTVQLAWRRTFSHRAGDILDGRWGCGGCPQNGHGEEEGFLFHQDTCELPCELVEESADPVPESRPS